jgi:hypothetical protein
MFLTYLFTCKEVTHGPGRASQGSVQFGMVSYLDPDPNQIRIQMGLWNPDLKNQNGSKRRKSSFSIFRNIGFPTHRYQG